MPGRLDGKAAVVVGGGQAAGPTMGNGRATAIRFAQEGARVLVVDRDADSAATTARMIGEGGGRAESLALDIADDGSPAAIAQAAIERLGRIDILHNNVGIG